MHDCPTCKVPLHGYEEVCPACGTKQYVRPSDRLPKLPPQPGVNIVPIVIAVLILGVVAVIALQNSWIFQAATTPVQEDPLARLTPIDARSKIEDGIRQGLAAVGAKVTFKYTYQGQESAKNAATPVELAVDTSFQDPEQHKQVIDPIKDYMAPAKVSTLTVNDAKSHRVWTYSASLNLSSPEKNDEGMDGAAPAGEATQSTPDSGTQ